MSRAIGPEVEYHCSNDCQQTGCPGHTIREVFDRSMDIYSFEIDGKPKYHFDEKCFAALLQAHELAQDRSCFACGGVHDGPCPPIELQQSRALAGLPVRT